MKMRRKLVSSPFLYHENDDDKVRSVQMSLKNVEFERQKMREDFRLIEEEEGEKIN